MPSVPITGVIDFKFDVNLKDSKYNLYQKELLEKMRQYYTMPFPLYQMATGSSGSPSYFMESYSEDSKVTFWKNYSLYKHLADVKDEDGDDIYVYSIVSNAQFNQGFRKIEENPSIYSGWARYLPTGENEEAIFEEVAANWFQLLVEERELQDSIKGGINIVQ